MKILDYLDEHLFREIDTNDYSLVIKSITLSTTSEIPIEVNSTQLCKGLNADMIDGIYAHEVVLSDGSVKMTNNLDMGNHKITNVKDPIDDHDIVNLKTVIKYLNPQPGNDSIISGGYYSGGGYYTSRIDKVDISVLSDSTDFGHLLAKNCFSSSCSNGINNRGIIAGGSETCNANERTNVIQYVDVTIMSDAMDFGDLLENNAKCAATSNGSDNRGIFMGGLISNVSTISYINISNTSNALAFGDTVTFVADAEGTSNGKNGYGIVACGESSNGQPTNTIQYVNINTLSDSINFGESTLERRGITACSNDQYNRAIFMGGCSYGASTKYNVIDYVDITIPANANDFGDLMYKLYNSASTSNGKNNRGMYYGGRNQNGTTIVLIQYININISSNANNFGNINDYFGTNHSSTSNGKL